MPPLIIASSTKKTRLSRIGADSSNRQPAAALSVSACGAGAGVFGSALSRTASSTAATAKPRMPAPMKAPRQPHRLCIISRLAGATADPSMPAKVWNEKAWPMRSDGTWCDSSA